MQVNFKTGDMASYRQFLRLKKLPTYSWVGTSAIIPDEYSHDGQEWEEIEDPKFLMEFYYRIRMSEPEHAV